MNTILLVGVGILLAVAIVMLQRLLSMQKAQIEKVSKEEEQDDRSMTMLNQNLQGMQTRLDTVAEGLNSRLDKAAHVMGTVNRELGTMQEIGRGMKDLQDFLKSPKLRGNLGEQVLQQMLDQAFPAELYQMQYQFEEGKIVDAIIRSEDGIIPVDAKFPMENYQKMVRAEAEADQVAAKRDFIKDIKKHINDISKKYILPAEGTVDFAIMYVPSEAVYYEVISDDSDLAVNPYATEKRVLFVSPNSFYYFLRVIMMGMQGKKVAEATREIIGMIRGIQKDAGKFGDSLRVLNKHIGNAKTAAERVGVEYDKLEGKIERIDDFNDSQLLDEQNV
jgi:DNA recombination protein RmuC